MTIEFLREVYAALRTSHDYVIVDTPPGFTPEVIASIDSSTHVCMVGMLDSLSLKNTKLGLETLELMGYDRERIRLVLNRADSRVGHHARRRRARSSGASPTCSSRATGTSRARSTRATPIVLAKARSDAAKAFRSLAAMYDGRTTDRRAAARRRRLGRKR